MIHIVMVEPEIPSNTGNVVRTAAVTGSKLHLVKPLGFSLEDKYLKRAGLDYWDKLDIEIHESFDDYLNKYGLENTYLSTLKGKNVYSKIDYKGINDKNEDIFILFGKETKGLPEEFLKKNIEKTIRIPMKKTLRCLNLSNSVNIVIYEILRQLDFLDFEKISSKLD